MKKYVISNVVTHILFIAVIFCQAQVCTNNNLIYTCNPTQNSDEGDDLRQQIADAPEGSHFILRSGVYRDVPQINVFARNVTIEGEGSSITYRTLAAPHPDVGQSVVLEFSRPPADGIHGIYFLPNAHGGAVRNIFMTRPNRTYADVGVGIVCERFEVDIENVAVLRFMHGIYLRGETWNIEIRDVLIRGCMNGIVAAEGAPNKLVIEESSIVENFRYGIWLRCFSNGHAISITDNTIERNGHPGINVEAATGLKIANNYFEGNEWQPQSEGRYDDDPCDWGTPQRFDAHIRFNRTITSNRIMNVSIEDNYFHLDYCTDSLDVFGCPETFAALGITYITDKEGQFSKAWINLSTYGIKVLHKGNYYRNQSMNDNNFIRNNLDDDQYPNFPAWESEP